MEDGLTLIHCSALTRWSLCEKAAVWRHLNPMPAEEKAEHIATWIGTAVHSLVAVQAVPDPPRILIFDGITPTIEVARRQIDLMAEAVEHKLNAEAPGRWDIMGREIDLRPLHLPGWPDNFRLTGRMDFKLRLANEDLWVCDLKTAQDIAPAWVQLGAYRLLDRMSGHRAAGTVATFHCPRPKDIVLGKADCTIWTVDADAAEDEALRIVNRITEIIDDPDLATAAPGNRCSFCKHPECVVRAREISLLEERMGE